MLGLIINRKEYIMMERKIGWGTSSIGILIFSILFSVSLSRTFCLGDVILKGLGLKAYSALSGEGIHYTIFYSVGMLVAGYIVARIFSKDFGAKIGRRICLVLGVVIAVILLTLTPAYVYFVR